MIRANFWIICLTVFLTINLLACNSFEKEEIKQLDCRNGRKICLFVDRVWEASQGLYYTVSENGQKVVEMSYVGYIDDLSDRLPYDINSLNYKIVSGRNGDVVAVIAKELPYSPIILHDFENNMSWPKDKSIYQMLREKVEAEHPEISPMAKTNDIQYLNKVKFLYLSYSQVNNSHLNNLRGLENIETLHLDHTMVSDEGLKHLLDLPNLIHLNLSNTNITDDGLKVLHEMNQLKHGWLILKVQISQNKELNRFGKHCLIQISGGKTKNKQNNQYLSIMTRIR